MEYIHNQGILFRDLKSSNILLKNKRFTPVVSNLSIFLFNINLHALTFIMCVILGQP